jgi:hypothetical protein
MTLWTKPTGFESWCLRKGPQEMEESQMGVASLEVAVGYLHLWAVLRAGEAHRKQGRHGQLGELEYEQEL